MPSNEQRRQAAKQKLESQMTRQAEQAKRRRVITIGTTVAVVVALVVGVFLFAGPGGGPDSEASSPPPAGPQNSGGPCGYAKGSTPAAKPVSMPQDPNPTPAEGTQRVMMKTSQGEIPIVLDRAKAPCTAQSFAHLTQAKYFDNTDCHRMTTGEGLKVLQCGDPSASGSGGPGYEFKDELPKDLKPAPAPYDSKGAKVYPRGTLAMANSGANTNGSQFFMVYEDSFLPANYSVFGTIEEAGLATLDKVAAGGVQPVNGEGDGKPNLPVHIDQATAGA